MRASSLLASAAALAIGLACATASRDARAADMDPAPERLVVQPTGLPQGQTCQSVAANPGSILPQLAANFPCRPDNLAFKNLMSELGFATAPTAFHPARTTGFGGFALTVEASFTHVNADASYWKNGTEGAKVNGSYQGSNPSPDSLLQVYSLKARKGLPYGLELTGALGYVPNTTLWVVGADVRWALLEGFRTGALGILPDVAVGGGVRTVTGSSKFNLTTVGIDVQLSKPVPLADAATLTPYVGYQRLLIFGDSIVVDTTPNVDAFAQCGYQGTDPQTGAPKCKNKLPNGADNNGDFNNNVQFDKVRTQRHRGLAGLAYRYEALYVAGQFLMDLTPPSDENPGLSDQRQWTLSFEAGVFF